jgi:hypothetical protein
VRTLNINEYPYRRQIPSPSREGYVKHTTHAIHTSAADPPMCSQNTAMCPQTHTETFYLNCIYSWVNFAKPETSFIIYTHIWFSVSVIYLPFLPSTFSLPAANLLYPSPATYPLSHLFLLFDAKHGHTKSPYAVSNCDLYFMPFCFQRDETSRRLNWPEIDYQRLSSPKATTAGSASQLFCMQSVGSGSNSLWLQTLNSTVHNPMLRCCEN